MSDASDVGQPTQPGFIFRGFWVRHERFEEIQGAEVDLKRPERVNTVVFVSANVVVNPADLDSLVNLDFKFTPDPKFQPYTLEVGITGRFGGINITAEQLQEFCKVNG